jgi:hypothetical protein
MQVHAQTTIDMATLKKAIIMEEQSIMPLFIVLNLLKLWNISCFKREKNFESFKWGFKPPLQFKQRQALPTRFQNQQLHFLTWRFNYIWQFSTLHRHELETYINPQNSSQLRGFLEMFDIEKIEYLFQYILLPFQAQRCSTRSFLRL